jgi:hypothetical protein
MKPASSKYYPKDGLLNELLHGYTFSEELPKITKDSLNQVLHLFNFQ